jgi:hypothetical protein
VSCPWFYRTGLVRVQQLTARKTHLIVSSAYLVGLVERLEVFAAVVSRLTKVTGVVNETRFLVIRGSFCDLHHP